MKTNLFSAIVLTLLCVILFVVIYSGVVWGIAHVIAPAHGQGEVVLQNGKVVGYANVGQSFTMEKYFWSRPSAVNYNAAGSAGSNKGPSNPDYLLTVQARIDTFLIHNPKVMRSQIPTDLVTASGSGLDPHISIAGAKIQVARIAKVRNIPEKTIYELIAGNTESPLFGFLGTTQINVLKINLALDNIK